MEIFSTWYCGSDDKIQELSQDVLIKEMKRAECITIIAAYYSICFLERVLNKVNKKKRKKCVLRMVFNGFGGQRLHNQVEELKRFSDELRELGFSDIQIYLNRETTLFHTKLYFIKNDLGVVWFSGSANASVAAFEKNEELLFKSRSKVKSIESYVSLVVSDSILVENIALDRVVESNIIGFFRTGSIYFKPNNKLSFTFSDFKLPSHIEGKLKNINSRPRNTNPGKAWGAYNLKMSLGLSENESESESEKSSQISLKPWSIETCYGYWVPSKYRCIVNESVEKRSKVIKRDLIKILNLIKDRGVESLVCDYEGYLGDAESILELNNIDYPVDKDKLIASYRKFVERIVKKLSDEARLEKLCIPLVSTGMPEIWEDNVAYEDFSESFYDYITSCLSGKLPRVVRSIKEKLELSPEMDSEAVALIFDEYFEYEVDCEKWSDECWLLPSIVTKNPPIFRGSKKKIKESS